jgi:hypothetical protein
MFPLLLYTWLTSRHYRHISSMSDIIVLLLKLIILGGGGIFVGTYWHSKCTY